MSWTQQTITFLELTGLDDGKPVLVNVADISGVREHDGYSAIALQSRRLDMRVRESVSEIIKAIKGHNERAIPRTGHPLRTPDHTAGQ